MLHIFLKLVRLKGLHETFIEINPDNPISESNEDGQKKY